MSHRVVRASKFRNVFGTAWKKDQCHSVRVSKSSWDSTFCSVNPKFLAVITESAGGGAFIVIKLSPQDKVAKLKSDPPVVSGHKGPVLDIAFSPHNDNLIASGSEDCSVKLWLIPEEGLTKTLTEPITTLSYHQRRVGLLLWHPTGENVLLTAGSDNVVVIWDVVTAIPNIVIESHPDVVYSASWNWNGSRFLTTCRDKKIRIINPRTGVIEQEAMCHEGSKASRAIFLKDGRVFTTGFSKNSERQFSLRDASKLNEPLDLTDLDTSNGVLFPLYDPDANLIYLCGKGDSVIRYFEITSDAPFVHYIATFTSPDPQRGIGMMVKRGCNISANEIDRFYRLNSNGLCQVISMTVPRKSEMYQEDLYPSTVSSQPALSAEEWFSGRDENPVMMDLKTGIQIDENDNNPHPKLRRSSIPVLVHSQLGKTQSLPGDNTNHSLKEEVVRLSNLVGHLMERVRNLEGTDHEHRIQNLEIRNDVATRVTQASPNNVMENTLPSESSSSNHLTLSRRPSVSVLTAFWNAPIASISALGSHLSAPINTAYSTLPDMTPSRALSTLKRMMPSPLQSITSFSSNLISSISPNPRIETPIHRSSSVLP